METGCVQTCWKAIISIENTDVIFPFVLLIQRHSSVSITKGVIQGICCSSAKIENYLLTTLSLKRNEVRNSSPQINTHGVSVHKLENFFIKAISQSFLHTNL